jgi:hypothetical protein
LGNFCPPGSGSAICIRIRIQQLKLMRIRIRIRNPGTKSRGTDYLFFVMTCLDHVEWNLKWPTHTQADAWQCNLILQAMTDAIFNRPMDQRLGQN